MENQVVINSTQDNMGVFKRILNVFLEPQCVFESIKEKSKILVPIIIIGIAYLAITFATMPISENYTRNYLEKIYKSDAFLRSQAQITIDNADSFIDKTMKYQKVASYFSPILILLMILFNAIVFFVLFKILGGVGSFGKTFAAVVYAYFIKILGTIVLSVSVLITGNIYEYNSPGLLMINDKTSYLFNIINQLDIFNIWYYIVLALGLCIIHKVSTKKGLIGVLSLVAAFILGYGGYITYQALDMYQKYGITM